MKRKLTPFGNTPPVLCGLWIGAGGASSISLSAEKLEFCIWVLAPRAPWSGFFAIKVAPFSVIYTGTAHSIWVLVRRGSASEILLEFVEEFFWLGVW